MLYLPQQLHGNAQLTFVGGIFGYVGGDNCKVSSSYTRAHLNPENIAAGHVTYFIGGLATITGTRVSNVYEDVECEQDDWWTIADMTLGGTCERTNTFSFSSTSCWSTHSNYGGDYYSTKYGWKTAMVNYWQGGPTTHSPSEVGNDYTEDSNGQNGGYPILKWELEQTIE